MNISLSYRVKCLWNNDILTFSDCELIPIFPIDYMTKNKFTTAENDAQVKKVILGESMTFNFFLRKVLVYFIYPDIPLMIERSYSKTIFHSGRG